MSGIRKQPSCVRQTKARENKGYPCGNLKGGSQMPAERCWNAPRSLKAARYVAACLNGIRSGEKIIVPENVERIVERIALARLVSHRAWRHCSHHAHTGWQTLICLFVRPATADCPPENDSWLLFLRCWKRSALMNHRRWFTLFSKFWT